MRQTRFELSPDRLIMVQATIHALDYSKHVTIDLILMQVATYLFSLRSNSTPTECDRLNTLFL